MASTVRSHRANQGSIPCIGVLFYCFRFYRTTHTLVYLFFLYEAAETLVCWSFRRAACFRVRYLCASNLLAHILWYILMFLSTMIPYIKSLQLVIVLLIVNFWYQSTVFQVSFNA